MFQAVNEYSRDDLWKKIDKEFPEGKLVCEMPSNIAIVKYWGKRDIQLPQNPSLSFTLSEAKTKTAISWQITKNPRDGGIGVDLLYENKKNIQFEERLRTYFSSIRELCPFIDLVDFKIATENTFPHSAGIASSASGFASIAVALMSLFKKFTGIQLSDTEFYEQASRLARLGSGSASRSVFSSFAFWGRHKAMNIGSDEYAMPIDDVDPVFSTMRDAILIVDSSPKEISSSKGHRLMQEHPFAQVRYDQAGKNFEQLYRTLQNGDLESFIQICESEAMTLHALMATASPSYTLMRPNTLEIISRIKSFRKHSGHPVCFTMDAGPNVHLLFPEAVEHEVIGFIESELVPFLENGQWINDRVGSGSREFLSYA